MNKKVTLLIVLLMGVAVGIWLSGLPGGTRPAADALEQRQTETAQQPAAIPAREAAEGELGELRPFARKLEMLFQQVAEEVSDAVVLIEAEQKVRVRMPQFRFRSPFDDFFDDFFEGPFQRRRERPQRQREYTRKGVGSGCIIDKEGHILTNNHVVAGADTLRVSLADGRTFEAEVTGTDEKTELAVIAIKGEAEDLPTVKLGDSDRAQVGQWVIAIGNPFGLRHTVSAGIISATGRSGLGVAEYESMIQTDAAINPGNSGGPLVNLQCEVIGINTAIAGGRRNLGIGFAIPTNMVKAVLGDLEAGREVVRGYMGVYLQPVTPAQAEAFGYEGTGGALVSEVVSDTPAQKAGLKAGDIITEYRGQPVEDVNDLRTAVAATDPGARAELKVWRDGKTTTLTLEVGNLAEARGEDWLGLTVRNLTREMAREFGKPKLEGVLVAEVPEDSPASRYVSAGDVIMSVNRTKVESVEEYLKLMAQVEPGERALLHVLNGATGRAHFLAVPRPRER